jgi:hypothetical protein
LPEGSYTVTIDPSTNYDSKNIVYNPSSALKPHPYTKNTSIGIAPRSCDFFKLDFAEDTTLISRLDANGYIYLFLYDENLTQVSYNFSGDTLPSGTYYVLATTQNWDYTKYFSMTW